MFLLKRLSQRGECQCSLEQPKRNKKLTQFFDFFLYRAGSHYKTMVLNVVVLKKNCQCCTILLISLLYYCCFEIYLLAQNALSLMKIIKSDENYCTLYSPNSVLIAATIAVSSNDIVKNIDCSLLCKWFITSHCTTPW